MPIVTEHQGSTRTLPPDITQARDRFRVLVDQAVASPTPHAPPTPQPNIVYSLTMMSAHSAFGGTVTVGIFDDWDLAANCVRSNEGDLWETTYHLAVIEEVRVNVVGGSSGRRRTKWWFRFVPTPSTDSSIAGVYQDIECPAAFRHVMGFGVG